MEQRRNLPLISPNMEKEKRVRELNEKAGTEKYSEEEKQWFDEWKKNLPETSIESPLKEKTVGEIFNLLPEAPNYTKMETGFYFETNDVVFVDSIFEKFVTEQNIYEIAVQRINNSVFYMTIGGKTHGVGKKLLGTFYAHSHPDFLDAFGLNEEKQKNLPDLFVKGVLPSHGDLEIYLKKEQMGKEGTKIFSKNGCSIINCFKEISLSEKQKHLQNYRDAYFDLFDGKNILGFKTFIETKEYFKKYFGFNFEYHEFDKEKN